MYLLHVSATHMSILRDVQNVIGINSYTCAVFIYRVIEKDGRDLKPL